MSTATELREKRDQIRDSLAKVFTEAKTDDGSYDFRKVESFKDDIGDKEGYEKSVRVAEIVQQKNAELSEVAEQVEKLEGAEGVGKQLEDQDHKARNRPPHPGPDDGQRKQRKPFGKQLTEHPVYDAWLKGSRDGAIEIPDYGLAELKTLFETGAGWDPEDTRIGRVVDAATRPIQVIDIIPSAQTGQSDVKYMEETTRTHASAETAEGGTYPESTFALTEQTSPVRKIADSIPVTDEQLEDVAMAESYLEGRLRFGLRQRLDGQILTGDGIAPNLEGITNVTGIQTQAKGTDPTPDAIYKAGTKLRVTGRVVPTHLVIHPNDWQEIRLLRTSDGVYIWGNPSEAGPERIWGWPVVQADSLTENTALLGSFQSAWISLFERRGIVLERGFVGTQFTEGKQTLRASMRAALVVFRPEAFSTITGI